MKYFLTGAGMMIFLALWFIAEGLMEAYGMGVCLIVELVGMAISFGLYKLGEML